MKNNIFIQDMIFEREQFTLEIKVNNLNDYND